MNNTVIKVLNKEHGKNVIDWFNAQGINTNGYSGYVNEEDGGNAIYYGVIDSFFSNYNKKEVDKKKAKIITLPILEGDYLYICNKMFKPGMRVQSVVGSDAVIDDTPFRYGHGERVYANDGGICLYQPQNNTFATILEEFDMTTNEGRLAYAKKHYPIGTKYLPIDSNGKLYDNNATSIYEPRLWFEGDGEDIEAGKGLIYYHSTNKWAGIIKQEEKMKTQRLSRKGLKEIHSIACTAWKSTLEEWGNTNPLEDYIELTQEQVDNMFKACTSTQLSIVSKYLKEDDGSIDVSNVTYDHNGALWGCKYLIRHNAFNSIKNSFWLNSDFNWEVKMNGDTPFLVPTKKKQL